MKQTSKMALSPDPEDSQSEIQRSGQKMLVLNKSPHNILQTENTPISHPLSEHQ